MDINPHNLFDAAYHGGGHVLALIPTPAVVVIGAVSWIAAEISTPENALLRIGALALALTAITIAFDRVRKATAIGIDVLQARAAARKARLALWQRMSDFIEHDVPTLKADVATLKTNQETQAEQVERMEKRQIETQRVLNEKES